MFRHAPFAPLAFLALLAWPAAHAETCLPTQETPLHLALETPAAKPGARAIGNGEHRYRFTVRDPQRPQQPFRNGNYRIELPDGTLFPDGTRFFSGRADAAGRTAVFAFSHPLAVDRVLVQPRVGEGRFGQSFRLNVCGPFENLDPVTDRAYLEKLLFLYYEFREAGVPGFDSEFDILKKTKSFYDIAMKRLDTDLSQVYRYAAEHFRARHGISTNLYIESIERQMKYLDGIIEDSSSNFRKKLKRLDLETIESSHYSRIQ